MVDIRKKIQIFLKYFMIFIFTNSTSAYAIKLVDQRGREITLEKAPLRIASGSLASDEILLELFKDQKSPPIIALSTLVDNPQYSNMVQEAKNITARLGTEVETIVKLNPDLAILAEFNRPEMINKLEQVGIKTYILANYNKIQDIKKNMDILGKLSNTQPESKKLISQFSKDLDSLKAPANHPKHSVLSWLEDGAILGKNTMFDDMIHLMGINNEADKMKIIGWQKLSDELLIQLKPDYIIATGDPTHKKEILERIRSKFAWAQLTAVKQGKIIIVPERELSSLSHHVIKAMDRIYHGVYKPHD